MPNVHITCCQALFLDLIHSKFPSATTVNPAPLLPEPEEVLVHDCLDVTDHLKHSRLDHSNHPLPESDETVYTNGSIYVCDVIL